MPSTVSVPGAFVTVTFIQNCCVALISGVPRSATFTTTGTVVGALASIGCQRKTPLCGSSVAPFGPLSNVKVKSCGEA